MTYPDLETLREEYESGNISAVDYVTMQSDMMTREYQEFCNEESIAFDSNSSALSFMDYRSELFDRSLSL